MTPRRLICASKTIGALTPAQGWGTGVVSHRHFPIFRAAQRLNQSWEWRIAHLRSENFEFQLMAQLRLDKPNYKAWLIVRTAAGWAMVARLESHPHAGLHCHAECSNGALTVGEIDPATAAAIPNWRRFHRRPPGLKSRREWWETALKFFRAKAGPSGDLL